MRSYPIGRRRVLIDLGRGAVAVAVLAACSSREESPQESPQPSTQPSSTGATSQEPTPSGEAAGSARWGRANLGFVSAYVLVRGSEAAVVDTGKFGSAEPIGAALTDTGASWDAVKHVVLTHYHADHAGSIADVLQQAASATGYVGRADLERIPTPRPLTPVEDGAEVFGLQVVATPGHTAGHISLFDPDSGVLVAGDALVNANGTFSGSLPQNTEDEAQAEQSVAKLAKLPVKTIYFGHGDPLQRRAAAALRKLAGS